MGRIFIYGYGNLGYHIHQQCNIQGIAIDGIFSNSHSGSGFFRRDEVLDKISTGDFVFICTKDAEIDDVYNLLKFKEINLITCSGSVSLLPESKCGVWYPLYSFDKKNAIDWNNVPVFIEHHNGQNEMQSFLVKFSKKIGIESIETLDSITRKELHLLAVFANNFSNACYWAIEDIIGNNESLKFQYLLPIIQQTVSKLKLSNPSQNQTGPAIRNDQSTIEKHLELLSKYPLEQNLYVAITSYLSQKVKKE